LNLLEDFTTSDQVCVERERVDEVYKKIMFEFGLDLFSTTLHHDVDFRLFNMLELKQFSFERDYVRILRNALTFKKVPQRDRYSNKYNEIEEFNSELTRVKSHEDIKNLALRLATLVPAD
jgi:hypothetical protein